MPRQIILPKPLPKLTPANNHTVFTGIKSASELYWMRFLAFQAPGIRELFYNLVLKQKILRYEKITFFYRTNQPGF